MEPDPDWDFENAIVAAGPERARIGPVRQRQAAWLATAETLRRTAGETAPAVDLALRQGFVLRRRDLPRVAIPPAVARRAVRRREWTTPRHGVVCPLPTAAIGPSGTGDEIGASAAALVRPGTVVGVASAAALHALPLLSSVGPPTLIAERGSQACSYEGIRVHVAGLVAEDVDDWFGAAVSSVARTVTDLSRARGVRDGVVAADAALHEELVRPTQLIRAVERQRGWPGVRAARRVLTLADGRAESPLESLARLCFVTRGLPSPELQAWIETEHGWYRVDFLWPDSKLIVETDGMIKYRDWSALAEEKKRHEFLTRAGYTVVRLMWDDIVRTPTATIARLRAAL